MPFFLLEDYIQTHLQILCKTSKIPVFFVPSHLHAHE